MEKEQTIFSNLPKECGGLAIIICGLLFLIGAIRDWDWVLEGNGRAFNLAWVSNTFGRKIARILVGILSSVIIMCGIVLVVLM